MENIVDLGGKANSLIKLKENKFNVPNFFVVSSVEFEKFIKENNLDCEIKKLLKAKRFEDIKTLISNAKFPKDLKNKVLTQFENFKFNKVAVRSSAKNEDGKEQSFAGQFETMLYVERENLLSAIKKCWCSSFDQNVIEYMGEENLQPYSMSVIIQEMICANYSGVAFSLDPTSRSKNYSLIEVVLGDGEMLVSGSKTPSIIYVQRYLNEVDFSKGEFIPPLNKIQELERNILQIEKIYGCPIDVEWCVKDDVLYILQARPITAFNIVKERFDLILTREDCLYELQLYRNGEYFGIKDLIKYYYFEPLLNYNKDSEMVEIYYNFDALEESPELFFREFDKNFDNFQKKYNEVIKCCEYQTSVINGEKEFNFKKFIENQVKIQPISSVGNTVGAGWECSERVKSLLVEYRQKYDSVLYKANEFLKAKVQGLLPENLKKYIKVLTLEEILNLDKVNIKELEKRLDGYVYYAGKIYTCQLNEFLDELGFYIENEEQSELKGSCAFGGSVEGTVKIILKTSEFSKFNDGDILVTHMTTPKFTPILKKASGIITDEGGITCHASIIARELKIPCIIGVKSATKKLKNNMKIRMNADSGEIVVLN